MNPVAIIALIAGAAVLYSVTRTVKAAVNLTWNVTRFGIYHLASGGSLVLRMRLRIGNPTNTPITVNFIDVSAYLDPVYTTVNGSLNVQSRGTYIASLQESLAIVIQPNAVTEHDFYIEVRWADIAKYLAMNVADIISSISNAQGLNSIINAVINHPVLLQGNIKAENVNFPINQVVSFTDDRG
jgi:LEA14-like dessication related protein